MFNCEWKIQSITFEWTKELLSLAAVQNSNFQVFSQSTFIPNFTLMKV